jgi:hypothetical protein
MREIRPSGSEGGEAEYNQPFLPLLRNGFAFPPRVPLQSREGLRPERIYRAEALNSLG